MERYRVVEWLNYERKTKWKERIVAYFNILLENSSTGTEENNKNLRKLYGFRVELQTQYFWKCADYSF
jgi:hypothetical protein